MTGCSCTNVCGLDQILQHRQFRFFVYKIIGIDRIGKMALWILHHILAETAYTKRPRAIRFFWVPGFPFFTTIILNWTPSSFGKFIRLLLCHIQGSLVHSQYAFNVLYPEFREFFCINILQRKIWVLERDCMHFGVLF